MPALLTGRAGVTRSARARCFGDDAESDAFIYSLHGDLLAGRISRPQLEEIWSAGTYPDDASRTVALFESVYQSQPPHGTAGQSHPELAARLARAVGSLPAEIVGRIFIHLDRRSARVASIAGWHALGADLQLLSGRAGAAPGWSPGR